jgi:hypothetical protein
MELSFPQRTTRPKSAVRRKKAVVPLRRRELAVRRAKRDIDKAFLRDGRLLRNRDLAERYLHAELALATSRSYRETRNPLERFDWSMLIVAGLSFAAIWLLPVLATHFWPAKALQMRLAPLLIGIVFFSVLALFGTSKLLGVVLVERRVMLYNRSDEAAANYLHSRFAPGVCARIVTNNDRKATLLIFAKVVTAGGIPFSSSFWMTIANGNLLSWQYFSVILLMFGAMWAWVNYRDSRRIANIAAVAKD